MNANLYWIPIILFGAAWLWGKMPRHEQEEITNWAILALMVSAAAGAIYAVLAGTTLSSGPDLPSLYY